MSHKEFIGCMRDLYIDGRRMDMAAFVANNGTMAGRHILILGRGRRAMWSDNKSDLSLFPLLASTVP